MNKQLIEFNLHFGSQSYQMSYTVIKWFNTIEFSITDQNIHTSKLTHNSHSEPVSSSNGLVWSVSIN